MSDNTVIRDAIRRGKPISATRAATLLREIARLRTALEWYANTDNYDAFDTPGLLQHSSGRWINDRGECARKALRKEMPE